MLFAATANMTSTDWPGWLTALGTIGLAAFAFVQTAISRGEAKRLRIEAAQGRTEAANVADNARRDAEVAAERAQAEGIVAWSGRSGDLRWTDDEFHQDPNVAPARGQSVLGAIIRNNSDAPITRVSIGWCNDTGAAMASRQIELVPPRSDAFYRRPSELTGDWPNAMPLSLAFVDAHGIAWQRDTLGKLTKLG